ncbi:MULTISPECIES: type I glyceraldehyde-3-phosphate dehydrogenase [Desulfococcus]|jgi:glyceraldehyde 3-phosphate dehydrogenase|uniref:Glyceraldehyde 3-phosphate dehydrogenase, NAD(P) binding domain-containing protein n=1 Tax=Desulfococcus multivorans DSM 2059 TaxID=1121405 RepID=S7TGY4_DESML|nr:glyceraldehyde 3-phosphate dehydrogenase NAD-binding domain-containing protein [Desulfococcus multivorans]AOY59861.1 Gap2: glyceraldehyde-3-phosphate dehydrogenase (NAD(P)+) (phosphorylating) [Desulfococcus multivorans]AQV02022.1 glyceraldehyde-3-phosphate dehydrogenase [Desulfococcus multivorans]EPR35860.1 Glyceraldehyde 3-phosphate dehydrogenase, NAD(P) binding domain-containing protein [Desulfococcus multivorans DSM 2059]MDX9817664.1 glyceraldehyde 3-phosphate dehydrogenase NAD-binding do
MDSTSSKLGINGLGRIGKLTLWHHIARKHFDELVVNLGRSVGKSMADIAHYVERDSTYGFLANYLRGYAGGSVIQEIDDANQTLVIDGIRVRFLLENRNPQAIDWQAHDVRLVVDTTGQFLDPTLPGDHAKGSVRGHLESGAEKVVVSAPFKIKDQGREMPTDAVTTVMGVNDHDYDPRRHRIISNASCTTTCLAHMMKPLINMFGPRKILSASMATIHAATGSQQVLDRLPKAGAGDLRKNRSIMNNIILTSTGAAKALRLVIPEMEEIGFIAESVRIPTSSGSLVILVVNFQEEPEGEPIRRETINDVYRQAALQDPHQYLHFSEQQNVSGDIIGAPRAAAVIEGHETHTRTAEVTMDLSRIPGIAPGARELLKETVVRIPITQAVIYGWYDNEMGSYVNMLGDRTVTVAESM